MNAAIDTVESWISEQGFWLQVLILLAVLVPLCWVVGGAVDKVVELILRPHARREVLASAIHPAGSARDDEDLGGADG